MAISGKEPEVMECLNRIESGSAIASAMDFRNNAGNPSGFWSQCQGTRAASRLAKCGVVQLSLVKCTN